ncbi:hypothetical protein DL93DRAFT_358256 [Clavulina sp. PMI_390]|nr:hypothetical protein DL93DRAFT_358256 [Clavulina sp. PMI_390]
MTEHQALQSQLDEALSKVEEQRQEIGDYQRKADDDRSQRNEALMRGEIDRLRLELQKSEDNLSAAELEMEKLTNRNSDLERKVRLIEAAFQTSPTIFMLYSRLRSCKSKQA